MKLIVAFLASDEIDHLRGLKQGLEMNNNIVDLLSGFTTTIVKMQIISQILFKFTFCTCSFGPNLRHYSYKFITKMSLAYKVVISVKNQ